MGPLQVLPFQVRVDVRVMAMKECSTFLKTPGQSDDLVSYAYMSYVWRVFYPPAEMQLAYTTAQPTGLILKYVFTSVCTVKED